MYGSKTWANNADPSENRRSPAPWGGRAGAVWTRLTARIEGVRGSTAYRVLAVVGMIYVAVHLATLARSPLPWFDDTFFASVADSLYRHGELRLPVSPLWFDKPVYIYGPLYFAVTGAFLQGFGFDILQFRLPGLMFSLGIIALVFSLLRQRGVTPAVAVAACVLLALDPIFYRGSHTGRMDSMALFLLLLSLYWVGKGAGGNLRSKVTWLGLSGLAASAALLTTPRPGYMVPLIGCIVLYRAIRQRSRDNFAGLAVWGLLCLAPWLIWFLYAFGSIQELLAYYSAIPGGTYVGGFQIRAEHWPVLLGLGALLVGRRWTESRPICDELVFFSVAGIIAFYVAVHDEGGAYAFFMVPLAYMALGCAIRDWARWRQRRLPLVVVAVLLSINLVSYLARNALVALQWEARNPTAVERVVREFVPSGSRVVGDDKYYFAVKKSGSDFQYLRRGGDPEQRLQYHRDVYRPSFLITGSSDEAAAVRAYVRELGLVKLCEIHSSPAGPVARWIVSMARKVGYLPYNGYEGALWGRGVPATARSPSPALAATPHPRTVNPGGMRHGG